MGTNELPPYTLLPSRIAHGGSVLSPGALWAFGYERNNGTLGRFNHNGHSGGELEATIM